MINAEQISVTYFCSFPLYTDKGAFGEIYSRIQKGASKIGLGFLFQGSKVNKSG
jgi:hypothetical protein